MSESRSAITAPFDGACQPFNPGGHMGLGWVLALPLTLLVLGSTACGGGGNAWI
jgi:hypothetical protein